MNTSIVDSIVTSKNYPYMSPQKLRWVSDRHARHPVRVPAVYFAHGTLLKFIKEVHLAPEKERKQYYNRK